MPRLLVHETGIHFIDTFRFLAGEITGVYAKLRRLHPDIAGEDCGMLLFDLENGATAAWDANRFNESTVSDPRYTFGEMLVEGSGGSIRVNASGGLVLKRVGAPEAIIDYQHRNVQFAGDCVFFTQEHILKGLLGRGNLENTGRAYLRNLQIQEAVYQSAEENRWIDCRPLK